MVPLRQVICFVFITPIFEEFVCKFCFVRCRIMENLRYRGCPINRMSYVDFIFTYEDKSKNIACQT